MRYLPMVLLAACAADVTGETEQATTTAIIPTSDVCSQGVGESWCVDAPPFTVSTTSRWNIDGKQEPLEYAGATTLPFTTDDTSTLPTLRGSGVVHLQRVTSAPGSVPNATSPVPQPFLMVFLEGIPVRRPGGKGPANVEIYIDNARFQSQDNFVHSEDRRYVVDLSQGSAVATAMPIGFGALTTWTNATPDGTVFAAGGCKPVGTNISVCSGELRIPLVLASTLAPGPNLQPGIGFLARGSNENGSAPELAPNHYAGAPILVPDYQTVLFSRPKGFPLSFMQFNVRRFPKFLESEGFDQVDPKAIGNFIAEHDVVSIEEGWDQPQVQAILQGANARRLAEHKPPFQLYGPINFEPGYSDVIEKVVHNVSDTQGGVWILSWLPADGRIGQHIYSTDSCRGEDCLRAKGVLWVRLYLQDPSAYPPTCAKTFPAKGCGQPPSGDDFVDVYATHMQAASTMCDTTFDLQGWEIGVGSLLAALGSVEFLNEITTFTMLAQAELNCNSLSDPQARAMQLAQFETFVEQTAAKDRSAVLMGDFNIVGSRVTNTTAHVADPEYVTALAALHLGDPTVPTNDQISMLPPGLDLQEADTLRDEPAMATFLTDEPVKCVGTSIGFTPIATTSACTLAGDVDVPDRIDYIFVRPPQLPAVATTDPRWIVETQLPGTDHTLTDVWNSPFPTKDGSSQDVDHGRLSDHKPVVSALEFARLSNPPKYHPLWHHTVEQRVTGVNASMFDDCWLCGEVDPFAHMDQQILPSTGPSNWSNPNTTECTDISAPQFGVDACIDDWANTLPHTPPNETAIVMHDYVMDQDNTSSNDILQQGNWATFRYADGMYELDQMDSGNRTVSGMALETEEGTVGLCTKDFATVCQQITLTPVPLGQ